MPDVEFPAPVQQRPLDVLLDYVGLQRPVRVLLPPLYDLLYRVRLVVDGDAVAPVAALPGLDDPDRGLAAAGGLPLPLLAVVRGDELAILLILDALGYVEGQRDHLLELGLGQECSQGVEEGLLVADYEVFWQVVLHVGWRELVEGLC